MKKHKRIGPTDYIEGNPESAEEMVTKYGTYNIQPTNDTINDYPKIVVFPLLIRSLIVVALFALAKLCPNVSALCQLMPCTPHSCRGR